MSSDVSSCQRASFYEFPKRTTDLKQLGTYVNVLTISKEKDLTEVIVSKIDISKDELTRLMIFY